MENRIEVNGKDNAPSETEDILKQKPNTGFWVFSPHFGAFVSPSLGLYGWGDNTDSSFFSKIGSAPVTLDTNKVVRGANQLKTWYFNKGYFNATSSYQIDSLRRNSKKAEVLYEVKTGERYYINEISKDVETKALNDLIAHFSKDSLIKKGDPYDGNIMDEERSRLAQIFRNEGYYNFSKNLITFSADTLLPGNLVNIKMVVAQRAVYNGDTTVYRDHQKYHLNKIFIKPDVDIRKTSNPTDTLMYQGYHFVYDSLQYKPRYLTDAIHFKAGDKYNERAIKDSYSHLVGYKAFQLSQISFEPGQLDSSGPTLNAYVSLTPLLKRTLTLEPEITLTNTNPGISGSIGWIDRNLFGAGEALRIRLIAGVSQQPTAEENNPNQLTFEIGGEIGIEFPRFLLPFNTIGLLPKRMQPKSEVSIYYNRLERIEFDRNTFGGGLSYNWRESRRRSHNVDLLDLTYSQIDDVSSTFSEALSDIQRRAFTSEFISATRYTYTFNERLESKYKNPRYVKLTAEATGLSLWALDNWGNLGQTLDNGAGAFLNVQYFNYLKAEIDARYSWNFPNDISWVNRFYTGIIWPWLNSAIETDTGVARIPPFSRYFFMGGSNDLRAWAPYRLGAGVTANTNYGTGDPLGFATGTFKMLVNTELRFPIISPLYGAVFIDMGNVWYTGGLETEQTDLVLNDFLDEFAIGSGFGVRMDLDFFVIRFDLGVKLRDPALISQGDEWVIATRNVPRNFTYNIALGYPF